MFYCTCRLIKTKREYERSVARDTRNPFLRWIITQCHHLCVNNIMAQIVFIISVVVAKRESFKIMFENQPRNYDNCKCKNTHTSQCHQAIKMQQFENCRYRCLNIVSNQQTYRCEQQNKFFYVYQLRASDQKKVCHLKKSRCV